MNGGSVTTTGIDSHAVFASGTGSQVMLNGGNVLSTSGDGAFGLYAIGGGVINANGPTFSAVGTPSITTSGNGSIALYASGGGSTITADGASIITHGASAPGVQADTGGLVTLNGGSVTTTGIDAPGVS